METKNLHFKFSYDGELIAASANMFMIQRRNPIRVVLKEEKQREGYSYFIKLIRKLESSFGFLSVDKKNYWQNQL
jgi:hypothetical protein